MKTRVISLDILRILCMMLIILHHLTIYSMDVSNVVLGTYYNSTFWIGLNAFLVVGVNCFFLISGYFGIDLKISKTIKLLLLIWFWGWACQLLAMLISGTFQLTLMGIMNLLVPLHSYWFMEVYIVLTLLSKTLNDIFDKKDKKSMVKILIFMFSIFSIYSFFLRTRVFGTGAGYDLPFAIFLYLVGRSIKKFFDFQLSSYYFFLLYLTFSMVSAILACQFFNFGSFNVTWIMFYYNNPLVLAASISMFLMFKNCNWSFPDSIGVFTEKVSPCVLSVYLIHAGYGVDKIIFSWFKKYIHNYGFLEQPMLMICYMFTIFIICVMLELLRRKLLGTLFIKTEIFITTYVEKILR